MAKWFVKLMASFFVGIVFLGLQALIAESPLSVETLSQEIAVHTNSVPEFQVIRKEAERRGLRVWLFGGTAAAFAHYVKWDVLRRSGDKRFAPGRFNYDYTNIFRSNQDLDLVVDGGAHAAEEFQSWMKAKFPHFLGQTSAWEVRSLREPKSDKYALLDDFDFANQHTDSHSTALIEITRSSHDSVVRDLRNFNSNRSEFLQDVATGLFHFYFSRSHSLTTRAKAGKNPPIFSVIRYLIKLFQFELKIPPDVLKKLQEIVDEFNPQHDLRDRWARDWVEKNAKKLFQNAINIEYASTTLKELGLSRKLIGLGDSKEINSLSWWLSREPLSSFSVGSGAGLTASELGIKVLGHETGDLFAYESITRAPNGEANVFKSREGAKGEAASFGDGFYLAVGRKGAKNTGITIRFELDASARLGTDFFIAGFDSSIQIKPQLQEGTYIIVQNKMALRVIYESLDLSPSEYFELLANRSTVDSSDGALVAKLRRRLQNEISSGLGEDSELAKLLKIIKRSIQAASMDERTQLVLEEWFTLPISTRYPNLMIEAMNLIPDIAVSIIVQSPHWLRLPLTWSISGSTEKKRRRDIIRNALGGFISLERDRKIFEEALLLIDRENEESKKLIGTAELFDGVFGQKSNRRYLLDHPSLAKELITRLIDSLKFTENLKAMSSIHLRNSAFLAELLSEGMRKNENPMWMQFLMTIIESLELPKARLNLLFSTDMIPLIVSWKLDAIEGRAVAAKQDFELIWQQMLKAVRDELPQTSGKVRDYYLRSLQAFVLQVGHEDFGFAKIAGFQSAMDDYLSLLIKSQQWQRILDFLNEWVRSIYREKLLKAYLSNVDIYSAQNMHFLKATDIPVLGGLLKSLRDKVEESESRLSINLRMALIHLWNASPDEFVKSIGSVDLGIVPELFPEKFWEFKKEPLVLFDTWGKGIIFHNQLGTNAGLTRQFIPAITSLIVKPKERTELSYQHFDFLVENSLGSLVRSSSLEGSGKGLPFILAAIVVDPELRQRVFARLQRGDSKANRFLEMLAERIKQSQPMKSGADKVRRAFELALNSLHKNCGHELKQIAKPIDDRDPK